MFKVKWVLSIEFLLIIIIVLTIVFTVGLPQQASSYIIVGAVMAVCYGGGEFVRRKIGKDSLFRD